MKLYISPTSPYGRLCLARALQLGRDELPFQRVDPWQNPPELEAINPLSQIPVLVTDDQTAIPGTLPISLYLASTPPSTTELASTAQSLALLDMLVQVVKLVRFKAPGSEDHPLVARSLDALRRALPVVPTFDPRGETWPDIMLGLVLLSIKLRRPDLHDTAMRTDTRAAIETFAGQPLAMKTSPEALAATQARTVGEL